MAATDIEESLFIAAPPQLADLASEFGGDGDFIVCPGYTGTFGSATAVDKWGRLFIPGATTGYRITRSTLSTWRQKTAADERYAWWPAEMEKRGAEAVKVSMSIAASHPSAPFDRRSLTSQLVHNSTRQAMSSTASLSPPGNVTPPSTTRLRRSESPSTRGTATNARLFCKRRKIQLMLQEHSCLSWEPGHH